MPYVVTYGPDRRGLLGSAAFFVAALAGGALVILEARRLLFEASGLTGLVVFFAGVCGALFFAFVGGVLAIRNARIGLTVTESGLILHRLFGTRRIPWTEVKGFGIRYVTGGEEASVDVYELVLYRAVSPELSVPGVYGVGESKWYLQRVIEELERARKCLTHPDGGAPSQPRESVPRHTSRGFRVRRFRVKRRPS